MNLIRRPAVTSKYGIPKASIYAAVASGTFPPQIKLGPRAVAWVEPEVEAVIAARVRGDSDAQIRQIVRDLVAARQQAA